MWALSQENASLMIYSSQPFEHELHPGGDHVYTRICAIHCCFLCTWTLAWAIVGTQQIHPAECFHRTMLVVFGLFFFFFNGRDLQGHQLLILPRKKEKV